MKLKKILTICSLLVCIPAIATDYYSIIKKDDKYDVVETAVFSSCNQILLNGFSNGDGDYTVTTPQGNINVKCDMTTNGGGWTLVTRLNTTDENTRKWDDSFWVDDFSTGELGNNKDYMSPYKNTDISFKSILLEFNYNNGSLISEFNNESNTLNFQDSMNQTLSNNNLDFIRVSTNNLDAANFFGTALSFQVNGNGNDPFRLWYNKVTKEVCNQTGGIGGVGDINIASYNWFIEAGHPTDYTECQENKYRSYLGTNHGGAHPVITGQDYEELIGNPDFYTTDIINIYIK